MRVLLVLMGVTFALTACGNDPVKSDGKTPQEAVEAIRDTGQVRSDIKDSDIMSLFRTTCNVLDTYTPFAVAEEMEVPDTITDLVLDNATQAFCPEHRDAVLDYLGQ